LYFYKEVTPESLSRFGGFSVFLGNENVVKKLGQKNREIVKKFCQPKFFLVFIIIST